MDMQHQDTHQSKPAPHFEWSALSLAFVGGLLIAACLVIVAVSAPALKILGPSAWALGGAMHGLLSTLCLLCSTVGLYLGWRLFMGRIRAFPDLQLASTVIATLSFLTIVFGNWIYVAYRAQGPDSPRSHFLATSPEVHKIFFEFKEFAALFTLPLSVAAAFILWRYGREILERTWTRTAAALLLALHFFYLLAAYGLGAAVTKLKSI